MKILLVEDNPDQRGLLERYIRVLQHDVTTCVNAEMALETCQKAFYSLIILDLELKNTDAVTLCRQIRSMSRQESIILVIHGSDSSSTRLEAAIEGGADDYLSQPVNEKLLQIHLTMIARRLNHFTQLKQAEKALRESETRYRELADSITDVFFALDRDFTITYWNKASENLTGIFVRDAVGKKSLYDAFPEVKGSKAEETYLDVLNIRQPKSFLQTYQLKGKPAFFEFSVYPSRDGFSVFAKDITYHKQMEEALKKSWDYLENLNNSLGDAIFTVKMPDQIIDYVNSIVETIFGYTTEECIGKSTHVFFQNKKGYLHFAMKLREAIKEQKEILRTEHVLKRKDGELFTAEITTTFLQENGELGRVISIVRDITERKQMELALEQERTSLAQKVEERTTELSAMNAELARASRLKDEFLANMSHELRTPLNAILGYAKILKKTKNLSQLHIEGLDTIRSSGEHLLNLINDILDLSKIEAGRLELHPREFQLPEFLRQIAGIIRIQAEQKGIRFFYEGDPDLPVRVLADEKRLREILFNLLDNAVKFTEKGSVTFKVLDCRLQTCPERSRRVADVEDPKSQIFQPVSGQAQILKSQIQFQVKDTGIGIAPEKLKEIFLPFQQVAQQRYSIEGTGLGLAISQHLVNMMGGELTVNSTVAEGSIFSFELTLPEIHGVFSQTQSQALEIIGYKGEQRKILIVDDIQENRAFLTNMLLPLGFEIVEAENGQVCLETAVIAKPDVILLDLLMPVLDGFETAKQIRRIPEIYNTAIIAISASVFEETRIQSLQAGCNDFLSKPLEEEKLLECLQTRLNLEWVYHQDSQEKAGARIHSSTALGHDVSLPQEDAEILRKFAIHGNITRILERLEKIEALGDQFSPLVTELRKFARGFEINNIIDYLEKLEVDYER